MLSTILVPLDGSPLAERALPFAEHLGRAARARLMIVRAADQAEADRSGGLEAQTYLDVIAAGLAERGTIPGTAVLLDSNLPAEAIVDRVRYEQAELVVMATHGRSGFGRFVYGSVAEDVLRHAEVPVLMIPATGARTWPRAGALRVLVPLDGSAFSEEAIASAVTIADTLNAELLLLRVVPPPRHPRPDRYPPGEMEPAQDLDRARHYLEEIAAQLGRPGRRVTACVEAGEPAATITRCVGEQGAGLIAMATHGYAGLARLVLGSVAAEVLQHANVPVLLFRPTGIRKQTAEPVAVSGAGATGHVRYPPAHR